MSYWIARDKSGDLWFFENKPIKDMEYSIWDNSGGISGGFEHLFDDDPRYQLGDGVTWESGPVEVELVRKDELEKLKELNKCQKLIIENLKNCRNCNHYGCRPYTNTCHKCRNFSNWALRQM